MKQPLDRVDVAAMAAMLLGAAVAILAAFQLFASGPAVATPTEPRQSSTPYRPTTGTDQAEADGDGDEPAVDAEAAPDALFDQLLSFGSTSSTELHRYTIRVSTRGGPVQYQYAYRDRAGRGPTVTTKDVVVTRTFRSGEPAVLVAIHLGVGGGSASCSVSVDGVTSSRASVSGSYGTDFCVA